MPRSRPHSIRIRPVIWLDQVLRPSVIFFLFAGLLVATTACNGNREAKEDSRTDESPKSEESHSVAKESAPPDSEAIVSVPVKRPADSSGKFTLLDAADTGLDFREEVVPDHELARLYHGGFVVGGVAIGDVDGDGVSDVFCAGTASPSRLFRQTAPFRFADITSSSGLDAAGNPWSVGASFVDVDNDDDLDLYVCNYNTPNQLWINDGKGNFVERAGEFGVDVSDASVMAYFGDFDNDGFVDMYLLTYRLYNVEGWIQNFDMVRSGSGELRLDGKWADYFKLTPKPGGKHTVTEKGRDDYLFRNSGGRAFLNRTAASGISGDGQGMSAVLWDYDDDGDLDIYVCNDFKDPDKLYENLGNGKFRDVIKSVYKNTSWYSMGSDVADVNNDGRSDLYTVDMAGSSHYLSKALMGSMDTHQYFLDTAEPRQAMRNFLHINAGATTGPATANTAAKPETRYLETAQYSGIDKTDWSWTPILRDFDCDGWCDVYVTNGHIRNFNNPDFKLEDVDGMENKTYWNIHKHENPMPQANAAFRNTNGVLFEKIAADWGLDHTGVSYGAACGDLDQDGDMDLIVMNMDEPVSIYRNDTGNANSISISLRGTRSNRGGIGAKVRIETGAGIQVHEHAPHRGYVSSHEPLVHFGLGQQDRIKRLTVEWPSGIAQSFENIKANQRLTIVEPKRGTDIGDDRTPPVFKRMTGGGITARQENTFDDFRLQSLLPNKLSQLGPGVAIADLDRDGLDEIYVSTPSGQAKSIAIRTADGNAIDFKSMPVKNGPGKEEYSPLFFDADGDQDLDLYIVCGGVETEGLTGLLADAFLVNDNTGNFVPADAGATPDTRFSGSAAAVADYDRDGDLDLFVGGRLVAGEYPMSPPSMLMRNETLEENKPVFVDATDSDSSGLESPGMVTSALWSDVNNDGWIDLLLTTEWGPVRVYLNHEGHLRESTGQCGLGKHTGWWNGITGADFDRDGDIDYVVTNFGQNTKYSASQKKPARIYYGKFGGNEKPAIVEVKTAETCELPVRGKSCSQHAMPHLAEKFPTYHEFALADLSEIYAPSDIDSAQKFEATELNTCLLRNDGSGVFSVEPLPWLAQISPGFGVVATDVNSDGWTDLFIAQNFFTPQRETGRMAGGLSALFMGSESGKLQPLWPEISGIAIEADAKGAAISDFNNDLRPDLVVGINDEEPRFFYNQTTGNQPLVIRLVGSGKNRQAIGSRVEVVLEDGSTQTAEVGAGGSYLSQSTNELFFGLGESGTIRSIRVRWPDGTTKEYESPVNLKEVVELNQ